MPPNLKRGLRGAVLHGVPCGDDRSSCVADVLVKCCQDGFHVVVRDLCRRLGDCSHCPLLFMNLECCLPTSHRQHDWSWLAVQMVQILRASLDLTELCAGVLRCFRKQPPGVVVGACQQFFEIVARACHVGTDQMPL